MHEGVTTGIESDQVPRVVDSVAAPQPARPEGMVTRA